MGYKRHSKPLMLTEDERQTLEQWARRPKTDKETADAFRPFIAQGGTHEIKGNEITYRPITANNPNAMRTGAFQTSTFRLEGDTLWITGKASATGPIANPVTVKRPAWNKKEDCRGAIGNIR